ncbi:hypothetical protein BDV19DRAFT_392066 [Aspergillus venezuelensis]
MYPSNPPTQPLRNQNTTSQSSPSEPLRAHWSDNETNQLIALRQANSNLTWSEIYRLGHFPGRSLSALQSRYSIETRAREYRASLGRGGRYNQSHNDNCNTGSGTAYFSAPECILITDSEDENDVGESGTDAVEDPNFPFRIQKNGWVAYRNYPRAPTSVETCAVSPRVEEGPAADSDSTLSGPPLARKTMKEDSASSFPIASEIGKSRSSLAVHEPTESAARPTEIPNTGPSHDNPTIEPMAGQRNINDGIDEDQPKAPILHILRDVLNLQRRVLKAQRRARQAEERYCRRARRAEELERELEEAEQAVLAG